MLASVTTAYPSSLSSRYSCEWNEIPSSSQSNLKQICSKIENPSLGFEIRILKDPTPTFLLKCLGETPFVKDMLSNYDLTIVHMYMFQNCPFPQIPFSEFLSGLTVRVLRFRSGIVNSIQPEIFKKLQTVSHLDLSLNKIESLPSKVFDFLTNMTILNLGNNKLKFLLGDIFSKHLLYKLNLEDNQLESLPEDIFKNQYKLESLDIRRNRLTSIPEHIFDDQRSLRHLFLNENRISSISPGTFDGLVNAYQIILDKNIIQVDSFSEDWFRNTSMLNVLDMSNNIFIRYIPERLFNGMKHITDFSMENCVILNIPENLLEPAYKITYINFSFNNIYKLSAKTFRTNNALKALYLENNKISIIQDETFLNLTNLNYLNLINNRLAKITKYMFKGLVEVIYLELGKNSITSIDTNAFDDLKKVRVIDLSENRIQYLPKDIFIDIINLYRLNMAGNMLISTENIFQNYIMGGILDLSRNKLRYIEFETFPAMKLNISYNRIENINIKTKLPSKYSYEIYMDNNSLNCDCSIVEFYEYYKINSKLFKGGDNELFCSKPLHLKGMNLKNINKALFQCEEENCPQECRCYTRAIDKTTFMDCSNSDLEALPTMVVANVSILYMGNNRISSLLNLSKPEWKNLREISFENNQIIYEEWNLPKNLIFINLQNNMLSRLPPIIFKSSSYKREFKIKLGGNPWKCNCDLQNMKHWLISFKGKALDRSNITCEDGIWENGIYIKPRIDEIPNDILCSVEPKVNLLSLLLITIISVFGFLLALFLVIFYYKNKRTVVAYLYVHYYRVFLFLYNEEEMDEDKLYDAFICYSHEDRDVAVELSAELESKAPFYTLCIHERDWTPGNMIEDNVAQSVKDSRRTVMILSEEFLKSPWFPVEFRTAYRYMLEENMDRMIIVIKGQLPDESTLDSDLKYLLQTKTYLEWKERWFWEKFRFAMPHKPTKPKRLTTSIEQYS
ncbi:Tl [Cordylochernes scorpioides]|uniref:Tl n=1 Tax=Cordylochernes scorpioides TaxID=51811 RepID=A0ABY6LPN1_9ARAC|nr:Tl [Cordylochernes scorpioides]